MATINIKIECVELYSPKFETEHIKDALRDYYEIPAITVTEINLPLLQLGEKLNLLNQYSLWLEEQGYMDTDWRTEEPFAIDEFLKTLQ